MNQAWKNINEILWECPYEFGSGISRSLLLKISEKKFLVYSPGVDPTAELAKEIIPDDSELFLLEPNSYHNLGLASWQAAYPGANPVAGAAAIQRLEKKTGIKSKNIESIKGALPGHITLLELPHNKIGEVWVDIKMPNERIWIVGDAFFNFPKLPGGLMGLLMRLNRMGPGIETSRMFQYLGTSNKNEYGRWFLNEINDKKPTKVIPLHGDIYQESDLIEKLEGLVKSRLIN